MAVVDEISPVGYGRDAIGLSLSLSTPNPKAFSPVVVDVDYAGAEPEGVRLPLELLVIGPSGAVSSFRRVFRRGAPAALAFTPIEGGSFLVRLAEQFHNRYFGALVVEVAGSPVV